MFVCLFVCSETHNTFRFLKVKNSEQCMRKKNCRAANVWRLTVLYQYINLLGFFFKLKKRNFFFNLPKNFNWKWILLPKIIKPIIASNIIHCRCTIYDHLFEISSNNFNWEYIYICIIFQFMKEENLSNLPKIFSTESEFSFS